MLPSNKILTVMCPECHTLLVLRETTNPDFVVIDEEEIPGD